MSENNQVTKNQIGCDNELPATKNQTGVEKNSAEAVQGGQKEPWYKVFNSFSLSLSIVAVPIITAWLGHEYMKSMKEMETNLAQSQYEQQQRENYIKLGLKILNESPNKDNSNLREWAVQLINHYSDVKMKKEAELELINKISIPTFSYQLMSLLNKEKYSPPHTIEYTFSWVGDAKDGYAFELESQKENGDWEKLNSFCLQGTEVKLEIPTNTNLRWKAWQEHKGFSMLDIPWQYIFLKAE